MFDTLITVHQITQLLIYMYIPNNLLTFSYGTVIVTEMRAKRTGLVTDHTYVPIC